MKIKILNNTKVVKASDENIFNLYEDNNGQRFAKLIIDVDLKTMDQKKLLQILNMSGTYVCSNYEDALFINDLLNNGLLPLTSIIVLTDDLMMKDRSYIDKTLFKGNFDIPLNYYMWGVKTKEDDKYNRSRIEVERIVSSLKEFDDNLTDIEKIIIIINYIQRYSEYIWYQTDTLNRTQEQFRLLDTEENKQLIESLCHSSVGQNPSEMLFNNYASCMGLSELLVMMLDNPYVRIRCELVSGDGHCWNLVMQNGKYYHVDITRSITYSPYRAKNNLRTTKFNKNYILVGSDFLESENHETINEKRPEANLEISKEDFSHDYIDAAIEYLESTGLIRFEYENEFFYQREASHIRK